MISLQSKNLLQKLAKNVGKRSMATSSESLVKTALYDMHVELGGDMVPFAGYELPVLYKGENGGVMKEHLWFREEGKASRFVVSHMGQVSLVLSSLHVLCRRSVSHCNYFLRFGGIEKTVRNFLKRLS